MVSFFLLFSLTVASLGGCANAPAARPADAKPLEARAGIVFLVHGIWPDGGWVADAERAFRAAGLETVPVEYTTFIVGYLFGFGTDVPAERLAGFVRALGARHAATGCPAPLRFHSVAYSGGTVVTLKAAWRGVRFETAHFGGSPVPCFSPVLADAVRARQIGSLVNYWSPFDGVTGWSFGASQFAYLAFDDDLPIRNVPLAYYHLFPPFDEDLCGSIARDLAAAARSAPPHRCFADPAFAAWWRRATSRLAEGDPVDPLPPPPPLTASRP